jgi:hypothetical protein
MPSLIKYLLKPALKMLGFFRAAVNADEIYRNAGRDDGEFGGLATLEIRKVIELSTIMENIPTLQIESVERWVAYWKSINFLKTG